MSTSLSELIGHSRTKLDAILLTIGSGEKLEQAEIDGIKKLAEHASNSISGLAEGLEGLGDLINASGMHADIDGYTLERIGWLMSLIGSSVAEMHSVYMDALRVIHTAEGQS